jgi:glycerophosphoryl diester phosphodiesterase
MKRELFPSFHKPLLFGHRGYSELAPENTMAAFELCVSHGIPGIELDVHICRSGELVVVHDNDLQRVAGVNAQVKDLSFEELSQIDVGSHKDPRFSSERIPTLDQVFSTFGTKVYYDIEMKVGVMKDTGIAAKTLQVIQDHRMEHHVLVSSFNPFAIRYFNTLSGRSIPTAIIYAQSEDIPKLLQHGWGHHIARSSVMKPESAQTEQALRKFNRPVLPWTIDDLEEGTRLLAMGVEGLISNNPGLFQTLIDQR